MNQSAADDPILLAYINSAGERPVYRGVRYPDAIFEQNAMIAHNRAEARWDTGLATWRLGAELAFEEAARQSQGDSQREQGEAVGDVVRSRSDGSISKLLAPRGWSTYSKELDKLKEHSWVKSGAADIVPVYLAPAEQPARPSELLDIAREVLRIYGLVDSHDRLLGIRNLQAACRDIIAREIGGTK